MKNDEKAKLALLVEIEALKAKLRRLESQPGETSSPGGEAEKQLFRIVAEAAPLGIFVAQGTRFVYVNSAFAGLVGLDPAEMTGLEYWEMVHPEDRAMVRERGEARQRGVNVPDSYVVRFVNAAGETRWANFRGTAIQYQRMPAVLGFVHDITENRETEKLLEASEEEYRTLVESAGEAIFSTDRNGIFLFMNKEAARQLGGRPDEFIGKSQWEIFPKWLADRKMEQIKQVFETGQGFTRESDTVMLGKECIHQTTGVPVRNTEGEITAVLGIAHDITELRQTMIGLQKSEDKYKRFIDNLPVGVFQSTPEGNVLSANPAIARTFGCDSVEEYLAIPAENKWTDPEQRREWLQLLEQKGTVRDFEVKLKRKDGMYIWVSVSAQGSLDEHNKLIRIDGVEIDLTARRKAEDALRRSGESMRALLNAPSQIMLMVDAKGTLLALNDAAAKETGLSIEAVLGTCAFDYMTEDVVRFRAKHFEEVFRTGRPIHFEECLGERFYESTLYPVFGDKRQVEAIVVSSINVSETRSALDALRNSEEKYRNLFENAQAGIFRSTLDGSRVLAVNQRVADIFGYSVEEILATPSYLGWYDPSGRSELRRILEKRGFVSDFQFKARNKSGECRDLLLSARLYQEGGFLEGSVIDITERLQSERVLHESEEKYRHMFENAQVSMFRSTLDGSRILAANCRAASDVGYSVAELMELPATNIWVDQAERAEFASRLQRDGLVRDFEMTCKRRDGKYRRALVSAKLYPEKGYLEGSALDITEWRKARQALEESEELFRVVADTAPVAIVINQGDKLVYANRTALNAVGMDAAELGNVSFPDLIHPDHRQMVTDFGLARQRGEDVPTTYEAKVITKSGEERWALFSGSRIEYNGRPAALGIAVDITERKRTEEELRLLTHRLSIATKSVDMGVWDLDLETNHLVWNDRMYQMYGVSESEFGGAYETWQKSVHPDDFERASREVSEAVNATGDFHTSFRIVLPDGQVRHIEAHALVLRKPDGTPNRMVGVNLDVTERKLMEGQLRESGEKFRRITERSFDAILHVDVDGMLTYASPAAERLAGYRPDDVIGRHVSEFITEKDLPAVGRALAITTTGQTVEGLQFEIIAADGHLVFVEANATPIIHDHRVVSTQAIVRDITARRKAEQMLEQAYEDQSRQLRQVAGGIAHDIYNDLYPVSAAVHKLRQRLDRPGDPDHERNLRLLQLMDGAVSRAIDLTETVSFYSKLQRDSAGTITRVRKVVDQVLVHYQDRLDMLGVKAVVEVPDALEVACSERNLNSLLTNLLLNALDAMASTQHPSLSITARRTKGKVEITFNDNGPGIAPDVLPRVFDPFFSTKPNTGTGLGLAIARRVVDVCGGEIRINSALDIGTTFHIFLPGDVGT